MATEVTVAVLVQLRGIVESSGVNGGAAVRAGEFIGRPNFQVAQKSNVTCCSYTVSTVPSVRAISAFPLQVSLKIPNQRTYVSAYN